MIYPFSKLYDVIEDKWVYAHYDENNQIVLTPEE